MFAGFLVQANEVIEIPVMDRLGAVRGILSMKGKVAKKARSRSATAQIEIQVRIPEEVIQTHHVEEIQGDPVDETQVIPGHELQADVSGDAPVDPAEQIQVVTPEPNGATRIGAVYHVPMGKYENVFPESQGVQANEVIEIPVMDRLGAVRGILSMKGKVAKKARSRSATAQIEIQVRIPEEVIQTHHVEEIQGDPVDETQVIPGHELQADVSGDAPVDPAEQIQVVTPEPNGATRIGSTSRQRSPFSLVIVTIYAII
ncbi:hypothetical protein F511_21384 [Dorcoceras hygrometricum]|uniref:Uncharacterized protein n=1 Tax=Dorcoceras hygrometricum TaxID=472368 RepID=A0A2Z7D9L3_9LAMI|nr:hypothetical protein F511_21384 [Dorcoceras hygrometricum]